MKRAMESISHLPTLSATIPRGTRKKREQADETDIIKPNTSVDAPRSSTTYKGKIGEMRDVIQ
jgi:hypothetical protein